MTKNDSIWQRIIMGGSGSTGSSLLKNILSRNHHVVSSIETHLLTKFELYQNWNNAKNRITKRKFNGLKSYSWHMYNGVDLQPMVNQNQSWEEVIKTSSSFPDFMDSYFSNIDTKPASHWLEKTPGNVFSTTKFLARFPNSKAIFTVRNPYDTIASLHSRGIPIANSVAYYLFNTSSVLAQQTQNSSIVCYEQLVQNPRKIVQELCDFISIELEEQMFMPNQEQTVSLDGWNHDEYGEISKSSVNRFFEVPEDQQAKIIQAVDSIFINPNGLDYFSLRVSSIKEICSELNYEYIPAEQSSAKWSKELKEELRKDKINRLVRFYPLGLHYPLSMND